MSMADEVALSVNRAHYTPTSGKEGPFRLIVQFNLELKKGQICTLQGPNQSGKTTLIKSIMGVLSDNRSSPITMAGKPVQIKDTADAIANGLVAVFQDDELIPSLSIRQQFRLRHASSHWKILEILNDDAGFIFARFGPSFSKIISIYPPRLGRENFVDQTAIELLGRFSEGSGTDYRDIMDKTPRQLSGGAKAVARLVLAQLTPNIRVFFLDEVFRGVQANVWPRILDSLRGWAKDEKIAMLAVTHYEEEIIRWQPDVKYKITDGKCEQSLPAGYTGIAAGLPLRVRSFPIYEIENEYGWVYNVNIVNPCLIIADKNLEKLEAFIKLKNAITAKVGSSFVQVQFLNAEETNKSLTMLLSLLDKIASFLTHQNGCIVVIGGGIILNFGAFIASTLHRGLPFILVPTTIMAIADVAIGGKTSLNVIDVGAQKHLLGTYANPDAVVLDFQFIETLPAKEVRLGLSECLKHGILQDKTLYEKVLSCLAKKGDDVSWKRESYDIALSTMKLKSNILMEDPWERKGCGYLLLYGHMHAHAIERVSKLTIEHGLTVFLGVMIDISLAGLTANFNEILTAFRESNLHTENTIMMLITQAKQKAFWDALKNAYKYDPKPQNHGQNDGYKFLNLTEVGSFRMSDNNDVKNAMTDASFDKIKQVLDEILSKLS